MHQYRPHYEARRSPDHKLPVLVGGYGNDRLCFRGGFNALVAWAAERGVGLDGWARLRGQVWVPVGHPDLPRGTTAQAPCSTLGGCEFPASGSDDHPGLCRRHAAAVRRAETNRAAREAERQEHTAKRQQRRQMSAEWVRRLAEDFGIKTDIGHDGRVEINGEGLHGLLTAIDADLPGLLAEVMPVELRGPTER